MLRARALRWLTLVALLVALLLLGPAETTIAEASSAVTFVPAKKAVDVTSLLAADEQAFTTGTDCQSVLFNPGLDYGYGWNIYKDAVTVDESFFSTPPSSFRMIEDDDGDLGSYSDEDKFGQVFQFPSTANSFSLNFKVAYHNWSFNDHLKFAFFNVDAAGNLLFPAYEYPYPLRFSANSQWYDVQISWDSTDALVDTLRGLPIALVFYTVPDNITPDLDVSIDDIELTLCTTSAVPDGKIGGTVSQNGSGGELNDALVVLTYTAPDGGLPVTIGSTRPAADGTYEFDNVSALSPGAAYQVWYVNEGATYDRLGLWAGSQINTFFGGNDNDNDFDVSNVDLSSPLHDAQVTLPATFNWNSRGVPGDKYQLCIYDIRSLDEVCTANAFSGTQVTIGQSDLENVSGSSFTFEYGRRYAWYVKVLGSSYNGFSFENLGHSYGANAITFVEQPSPPPAGGPSPDLQPPAGNGGAPADWTIMVYIAGDNNLGDPARYYDPSLNLQGQFASLKALARDYPNVNLVTLTDFYDESGTEFCHLKADGTQDCQQLGEKDTSDPQVLADFINSTLGLFTADHTMLVISDHGHGIAGVALDETTGRTAIMSPNELRQAFESASLDTRKLDILFYNVCLFGSLEAAYDASSFADYMVASADELWILNVYEQLLPLLADPAIKDDPRAVASEMLQAYERSVDGVAPGYFKSISAFDLSRVAAVNAAFSNLASVMADELATNQSFLVDLRAQVQVYDSSGDFILGTEDAFVDLHNLAELIKNGSQNPSALHDAAVNLLNALDDPVNGSFAYATLQTSGDNGDGGSHDLSNASGLSIYFPNGDLGGEQPTMTNLYLNRGIFQEYLDQTEWDEFLRLYISDTLTSGPGRLESGPGRLESGAQPVGGLLPYEGQIHLPAIFIPSSD